MIRLFLLISIALICFITNAQQADYIFKNVNVVTMVNDKVLPKQDVVISNSKIVEIANKTKYKATKTINAKGKYLMPSLADAHVHFPENEEEFEKLLKLNVINGVTKLRSMRGEWNDIERKNNYNTSDSFYPKLYLSAPPIRRNYEFTTDELEQFVKAAKDYNFDFIKILSIKNPEALIELDQLVKKYNLQLGGHFPDNPKGVRFTDEVIFNTGFKSIEHLGGLINEPASFENRIKNIKKNNIFICPTMQWYAVGYGQYDIDEMLQQNGMQFIPEEIKKDWAEKSKIYRDKLGKQGFEEERNAYAQEMQERFKVTKKLNDKGVRLLLSPDSSSKFIVPGFGMFEEMKLYHKAGLSNFDILKSATSNFSLLFNENYGTIEVGKDADFILLNSNPLEKISAFESIDGLFFNNQYLDDAFLENIADSILPK